MVFVLKELRSKHSDNDQCEQMWPRPGDTAQKWSQNSRHAGHSCILRSVWRFGQIKVVTVKTVNPPVLAIHMDAKMVWTSEHHDRKTATGDHTDLT